MGACAKISDKILVCVIKAMIYVNMCAKDDVSKEIHFATRCKGHTLANQGRNRRKKPKRQFLEHLECA